MAKVGQFGLDEVAFPLNPVQTFVLGRKAIFAAEAYVLGLFQLYPTVYFHKATRGVEKIYTELLSRARITPRRCCQAETTESDLRRVV
jgi:HD superfamily phosphohydrolase